MPRPILRRLPGFRFEVQAPPLAVVLPRMDVAVFVGFAASGPMHTPVVVEDPRQFQEIFGDDLPLAWDEKRGQQVYAYLAPAVRAFFRNGGRRCWINRVAATRGRKERGQPASNYAPATVNCFPIPGLVRLTGLGSQPEKDFMPIQAYAEARSEGSWSDDLRLTATLLSQPVTATRVWIEEGNKHVAAVTSSSDVNPGDLLRLTFPKAEAQALQTGPYRETLLLAVEAVLSPPLPGSDLPPDYSRQPAANERWVTGSVALWFKPPPDSIFGSPPASPLSLPILACLCTEDGRCPGITAQLALEIDQGLIRLILGLAPAEAPKPGSIIRLDFGPPLEQKLWLNVKSVSPAGADISPLREGVEIVGAGLWWQPKPPTWLFGSPVVPFVAPEFAERLTFKLRVQRAIHGQPPGNGYLMSVADLGFMPGGRRYWVNLPPDEKLFAPPDKSDLVKRPELEGLWNDARHPRFPLSGPWADRAKKSEELSGVYLPLGMSRVPDEDDFRGPLPPEKTALERNGLAIFSADLFLDPDLKDASTETLLSQADFLRYEAGDPRSLTGIHASLDVEEATLIAVPDAVHRGWERITPKLLPAPEPEEVKTPAEVCRPPRPTAMEGQFNDLHRLPPPELKDIAQPDEMGRYVVQWSESPGAELYTLAEATQEDFSDAIGLYHGPLLEKEFTRRSEGVYFYRVRGESKEEHSPWSKGKGIRVGATPLWRLMPITPTFPAAPEMPEVQKLHRALLRLCAARSDLFAVLSLPAQYRENEALAYAGRFEREFPGEGDRTLSFGALYHPWLIGRGDTPDGKLREMPPDGAVCGMIARRALARGAWVAPANEVLRDLVGLTPPLSVEHRLDLQEGRINIIQQEPRGFLTLSANTLSPDSDIRPMHVRRLLILLRRLAVREGMGYTFEPNDPAFRRMVQRSFEALLDGLFMQGAFAGTTPENSYHVETGPTVNTPQSVDAGRLIVELRVAPARALQFVTIRLVQTGTGGLQVLES